MMQYILECIAFQLVFLIIYDFFLKRETFFQWNRAYLIGTYVLSLVLPWVKIEAFKTAIPERYYVYPEYLWGNNDAAVVTTEQSELFAVSWEQGLFFGGMFLAALFFGYNMLQLYRLRRKGDVSYFKDFTRIVMADSNMAFSFFRSIFLGDQIVEKEYKNIIEHELVHIRQRHTYDLLFFEVMRILGWFNPLVYVYQNRVSELHEFIADAQVSKTDRKEQYELLLSQAFQTQNISFINQFFKSSLIKKRIVMLTKEKSLDIWKLKYLALIPMVIGMLFYTSCDRELENENRIEDSITVADIENLTSKEEKETFSRLIELSVQPKDWELILKDKYSSIQFSKPTNKSSFISGPDGTPIRAHMHIESDVLKDGFDLFGKNVQSSVDGKDVPFALVEEVPIFPGCEDAADPRACFQEKIQRHISKNFRYPEEAQRQGIQGRVAVMFTIDEQGNINNIRKRGPHKLLEEETVRIIERLPQMKPGKYEGKAVRVPFSIPITFKLQQAGFNTSSNTQEGDESSQKLSLNSFTPEPLVVIDGKESSRVALNMMSPTEIESIRVFKEEMAITMYGTKGKDGVIVVTTKKASNGNGMSVDGYGATPFKGSKGQDEIAATRGNGSGRIHISDYVYDSNDSEISGRVTDGAIPIPGVNIAVVETGHGVVSDFDGKFTIKAKKGDVIVFQYIGLPALKLTVTDEKNYQVTKKGTNP